MSNIYYYRYGVKTLYLQNASFSGTVTGLRGCVLNLPVNNISVHLESCFWPSDEFKSSIDSPFSSGLVSIKSKAIKRSTTFTS